MNAWGLRWVGAGLLLLVGLLVGSWVASGHFRALLDAEQQHLVNCKAARDNLAGLASEQGKALGDLVLAATARQALAEKAVSEARAEADLNYAAANRLQQERTGGDPCTAASVIIDKALGL